MRGTQTILPSSRLAAGIIPAYAGNTSTHTPRNLISRDHPRVCGEHIRERLHGGEISGSSPRMRGTRSTRTTRPAHGGIIPAYAGNTWPQPRIRPDGRDHPRVCGEHLPTASVFHPLTGSSPRMRGTRGAIGGDEKSCGIIPAYAGNTYELRYIVQFCGDHPRVCGEHDIIASAEESARGSSPRMRGTHDCQARKGIRPGIIPAYAGNTRCLQAPKPTRWDHPRVCGEHLIAVHRFVSFMGSSPRMRGTLYSMVFSDLLMGIIPAYAGNTSGVEKFTALQWDHPRVCGEHD